MSTTEGEKIVKKEIIELPDMESGVCSCEHVVHGQKVRPVDIPRTWGYYQSCQMTSLTAGHGDDDGDEMHLLPP